MDLSRREVLAAGLAGAVALKPENPLVAGTVLRRAAIRSPNFVTGVSGWTINQDGSAEFNNVTIRGGLTEQGIILIYSGTPAAGNLIASFANVSGTDRFGNAYLGVAGGGYVAYNFVGGVHYAGAFSATGLLLFTAPSEAGPYTQVGSSGIQAWSTANVLFGNIPLLVQQPGAGIFTVQETGGAPAAPPTKHIAQTAGDRVLGVQVNGDAANFRLRVDSNGRLDWGPGNAATDTNLFRGGVSLLRTDDVLGLTNIAAPAGLAGAGQLYGIGGQLGFSNASGLAGSVSGSKLASVTPVTVTQAAFTSLFNDTIPANDAVVGATYKATAFGFGAWGSTVQDLIFGIRFGATDATVVGTSPDINSASFAASALFRWKAVAELTCVTTGATAHWVANIEGMITQTANSILVGTAGTNSISFTGGTGSGTVTLDSTVNELFGISAHWGATTGAPTLTAVKGRLERVA